MIAQSEKQLITVCAWCKRAKIEGEWAFVIGEWNPENRPITHGICTECAAKMKAKHLSKINEN